MSEEKVTVCVWPYGGLSHFGHVGIKLKSAAVPGDKCYISWWPGAYADSKFNSKVQKVQKVIPKGLPVPYDARAHGGRQYTHDVISEMSDRARAGLEAGTFTPKTGQVEIDLGFAMGRQLMTDGFPVREEYVLDSTGGITGVKYMSWVQKPDKYEIPCIGQANTAVGLNATAIFRWWKIFSEAPTNWYKLMSRNQNCAGVAALALRAGGAASFAKPPKAFLFMDPNQVRDWVIKVKDRIDKLNTKVNANNAAYTPALTDMSGTMEIMTLAEWKTKSVEGVSKLAIRSSQIKKIDQFMTQYWAEAWGTSEQYNKKKDLLIDLLDAIHVYLAERAGHKREAAVLLLGEQVSATWDNRIDPNPPTTI